MTLDGSVKVAESDVAAALGASLASTTYTLYGLQVPQANIQTLINYAAFGEQNLIGPDAYNSTDPVLGNAVKDYQLQDVAYRILLSLRGYYPMGWFDSSVGNQRVTPIVTVVESAIKDQLRERDRAFNSVQQALAGGQLVDTQQPSYANTQPALY